MGSRLRVVTNNLFVQVFNHLSDDLAISVLQAAPANVHQQFSALPVHLHHFAFKAAFPSLYHHRTVSLDCHDYSQSSSTSILNCLAQLASSLTSPHSLAISNIAFPDSFSLSTTAFSTALSNACMRPTRLTLHIENSDECSDVHVEKMLRMMLLNTSLTTLDLSLSCITPPLPACAVAQLTSLRSLTLRNRGKGCGSMQKRGRSEIENGAMHLPPCKLRLLTHLQLQGTWGRGVPEAFLSRLQQLRTLDMTVTCLSQMDMCTLCYAGRELSGLTCLTLRGVTQPQAIVQLA